MIESDVVATGSVNGILSREHYNRSIRAHKLIYEAMQQLRLNPISTGGGAFLAPPSTLFYIALKWPVI